MGRDDCSQPADKQDCPGPVDNFVGLVRARDMLPQANQGCNTPIRINHI